MLEITSDDIAVLADDSLRELVARLCEAEMRRRQLPISAVTWGGHQDAADGGIDVRIDLPASAEINGFIPRRATGFQVKKPDLSASGIVGEMRPNGQLRPAIEALADQAGAYIIVSSGASATDKALIERRNAMASAVEDISNGGALTIDFYDRTRIASWVRDHPGLVPWVRKLAGRSIVGWQSYDAWANPSEGVDAEYLADDATRIRTGSRDADRGLKAVDGINRIREAVLHSDKAVRLIGLSGVGKTRLVQALFDERVGEESIDPALAIYTNMSDGPDPAPIAMVSSLVAQGARAVVVVDNCPPDLHQRLSELVGGSDGPVQVITIEYDIRDDQPEATDVFVIEPASIEMTEKLVEKRFPALSPIDARTIAEFSGGNARVAVALAGTVERGESISGLTDEELFKRLFRQRHESDPALLRSAKVCSLVYSFDGEEVGDNGELARLGKLVDLGAKSLYSQVAELRRRDLVQARSDWRAVLPHAVANRLAALALEEIPLAVIDQQVGSGAPERIKKSFSRRLSYLHGIPRAREIVRRWLAPGGMLSNPRELDEIHAEILSNIGPVAPEAVLATLENAVDEPTRSGAMPNIPESMRVLRLLAYEPLFFERCAELMVKIAVERDDKNRSEAADFLTSLFYAYLSGTHATLEQRVRVMDQLLRSGDAARQALGLEALRAMLEATHFSSAYDFQFGAHSRDYGYHPTISELRVWYTKVLKTAEALVVSDLEVAKEVQGVIAGRFRGLWAHPGVHETLERVTRAIAARGHWSEGWIAVRQTLHFDAEGMPEETKARLISLEKELRPRGLVEKVRSIVLSQTFGNFDLDDYEEPDSETVSGWQRTEALATMLGREVAVDSSALDELLPDIVSGSGRLIAFGRGLAEGATDARGVWAALVAAFAATSKDERNEQVLRGFLQRLNEDDAGLASELLEAAVEHEALGPCLPLLQSSIPVNSDGVERLRRALALGLAPIGVYRILAWGKTHATVSAKDLKDLIERISDKADGVTVALEIIFFRLYGDRQDKRHHDPEVIEAARSLLAKLEFSDERDRTDHELALIVRTCLIGECCAQLAKTICERFRKAAQRQPIIVSHYHEFFGSMCKAQPQIVLDTFFGGDETMTRASQRMLRWCDMHRGNPLNAIPEEEVFAWCDRDPETRYAVMAGAVSYLRGSEEGASSQWSSIAWKLLERAPDRVAVAKRFALRFRPSGWSGSLAAILESRQALLTELEQYPDPDIVAFAITERKRLAREIEYEREFEAERSRFADERFE